MTPRETAVINFIESRIESMLANPEAWGTYRSVEEGVLQLLELQRVFFDPDCMNDVTHEVMRAFAKFIQKQLAGATPEPLALQLESKGRLTDFVPLLRAFVEDEQTSLLSLRLLAMRTQGGDPATLTGHSEHLYETIDELMIFLSRQAATASAKRGMAPTPITFPSLGPDELQ